jgi:spermidine synthase
MPAAAAVLVCILALGCLWYHLRANGVLYVGRTMGGRTTVHNDTRVVGQRIRVLDVAGTYQSATYLDERWCEPVFRYHRLFEHLFDDWPHGTGPRTVCVLGGGGYALPKHLVAHHPELTHIDVVEIDPEVERIARRYFFLDRLERRWHAEREGRLALHIGDASVWLRDSGMRYDAILNDCFMGASPDHALAGPAGVRTIAEHLTRDGIYMTNVISALKGPDAELLQELVEELQQYFGYVWVYPCSPAAPYDYDNNLVVAARTDRKLTYAWRWPLEE